MTDTTETTLSRDLISDVEQFYFKEARLLDDRKFYTWFESVAEDIRFIMPVRHSGAVNPKLKETEALLSAEVDTSTGLAPPHRDEDYMALYIRVMRSYKPNSWTDVPPARTRRFVSNIEVQPGEEPDSFKCYSNIMISYSRHRDDNHFYTAQRCDLLRVVTGNFKIARREVLIDWNVITAPSLGIFF